MSAEVLAWTVQQLLGRRRAHVGDCSSGAADVIQWAGDTRVITPANVVERFGWSRSHALRVIRELKDAGLLVQHERNGRRMYTPRP